MQRIIEVVLTGFPRNRVVKTYLLKTSFGIENLALEDVPQPKPGPGQVLLKMSAWSLNYRDLLVVRGIYAPKLQFPFQMLSSPRRPSSTILILSSAENRRRVARRISRTVLSALSECLCRSCLIFAPPGATMSQKHSLIQSRHSVQQVLTGDTRFFDYPEASRRHV